MGVLYGADKGVAKGVDKGVAKGVVVWVSCDLTSELGDIWGYAVVDVVTPCTRS